MNGTTKAQTSEARFIEKLKQFEFVTQDMQTRVDELNSWKDKLEAKLVLEPNDVKGIKADSALARQIHELRRQIGECVAGWARGLDSSGPMRQLSEQFGDKGILLVFGKVNAGKSSFCNFLAERFKRHGEPVQYFYFESGKCIETLEPFVEAATEATARIQGIRLGNKLILLDTPGLHSVTEENGTLTKSFTDSADGVLWLTSSTSPGQVQELDELREELKRDKPLLPVITKSDLSEEDELDGAIVTILKNKTAANRKLQQDDVLKRAQAKLRQAEMDDGLVRPPVSVSALVVRKSLEPDDALEEAGFQRLFVGLSEIAEAATEIKKRKPAVLMLNHLQEDVIKPLNETIRPQLGVMRENAAGAAKSLDAAAPRISSSVLDEVLGDLAELLERHKATRDMAAVHRELNVVVHRIVQEHIARELAEYAHEMDAALVAMNNDRYGGFDDVAEECEVERGRWKKSAVAGTAGVAGAILGGLLGSLVPGAGTIAGVGVGEAVGAVLGGALSSWLGEKGGGSLVETKRLRIPVGVSYTRLYEAISQGLRERLPGAVAKVVERCRDSVEQVMAEVERIECVLDESGKDLDRLKEECR
ncbi:50S ribosome-binding GTPase [Paraburkholderia sp. RL17-383-BIF-A]|uniref:GTPase n=1 Tax=Paraburkholderia sp. RL17-383-BIF-A TaxID=3031631 RepID=UPI0038BE0627